MAYSYLRRLGRNPNYGLRRTKKEYKQDGQPPAGPKLRSLKRLFRRPYSERAHAQRVKRARWLMLALGAVHLGVGIIRVLSVADEAALIALTAGAVYVTLFWLTRVSAATALGAGTALFALVGVRILLALPGYGDYGRWNDFAVFPVLLITCMSMLLMLLALIGGFRSALALDGKRDTEDRPEVG